MGFISRASYSSWLSGTLYKIACENFLGKNNCHGTGDMSTGTSAMYLPLRSRSERQRRQVSGMGNELDNWLVNTFKTEEIFCPFL